jgi:hypothetical protein
MTALRFGGPGRHPRKSRFAWLVALGAVVTAVPCGAQSPGTAPVAGRDTGVAMPSDSADRGKTGSDSAGRAQAGSDSAGSPRTGSDSAGRARTGSDSAGRANTGSDSAAVAPGDTLARQRPDSAVPAARPAPPPPAPVDSALGAACQGAADARPDLFLIKFQPFSTDSERSAVAQEVGGTIIEMSQHAAPGSWYLLVPGSAGDPTVADRLILLAPVLEVGATRCPS